LIVKQEMFTHVNHAQIRSWNQPLLINEGKVSCSRKQWEPLMGLDLTIDRLGVRCVTYCATPLFVIYWCVLYFVTLL